MIPYPKVDLDDYLRQSATYTIAILTAISSTTMPTLKSGDQTRNALLDISTVLTRVDTLLTPVSLPPPKRPTMKNIETKNLRVGDTLQAQRVDKNIPPYIMTTKIHHRSNKMTTMTKVDIIYDQVLTKNIKKDIRAGQRNNC